jgi:hypothetical protein
MAVPSSLINRPQAPQHRAPHSADACSRAPVAVARRKVLEGARLLCRIVERQHRL